jgi:hypothetical protein
VSGTAFKEAFGDATVQKKPGSENTFLTGRLVSVGMEEEQVEDERVFRRKESIPKYKIRSRNASGELQVGSAGVRN